MEYIYQLLGKVCLCFVLPSFSFLFSFSFSETEILFIHTQTRISVSVFSHILYFPFIILSHPDAFFLFFIFDLFFLDFESPIFVICKSRKIFYKKRHPSLKKKTTKNHQNKNINKTKNTQKQQHTLLCFSGPNKYVGKIKPIVTIP